MGRARHKTKQYPHWRGLYRVAEWPKIVNGLRYIWYCPQYYDEDEAWHPYTVVKQNKAEYDTMEVKLFPTRLEAEQYIEVMIIKEKREYGILPN